MDLELQPVPRLPYSHPVRGNMVYEYMWGSQECTTCCARMCYSCIHACVIHVSVRYVCVSYSWVIPVCVIHVLSMYTRFIPVSVSHVCVSYSCNISYPCMCYSYGAPAVPCGK